MSRLLYMRISDRSITVSTPVLRSILDSRLTCYEQAEIQGTTKSWVAVFRITPWIVLVPPASRCGNAK